MSELFVYPIVVIDDTLRLYGEFRTNAGKGHSVSFLVPKKYAKYVTNQADPFVLAFLFLMMREGQAVRVHGCVSPSLLRNLEEYMAIWQLWRPGIYQSISITADQETDLAERPDRRTSLLAFSGGVDSCCIALRHVKKLAGRRTRQISAGLFVHGFDIPLGDPTVFEAARKKNENILESLNLELLHLATDYRALPVDWNDSHGAALAACLSIFSGRFDTGIIAPSAPYDNPVIQFGSTPVADSFLSSKSFGIIHDGAELTRIDRAKLLLNWPEALQNLRVCWKGQHLDRNCGRCDKCIRTLLEFRVLGVKPAAFEQDVSDDMIRQLGRLTRTERAPLSRIVTMAKAAGFEGQSWVLELEKVLRESYRGSQAFTIQQFCAKPITITESLAPDADILWVEGSSAKGQTPEFKSGDSLTPHVLAPLIQFPLAIRLSNSWANQYEGLLQQVTYPFDLYWLGMLTGATIRVQVLGDYRCPPRIEYRLKDWLPFGVLEANKEKITSYQAFFHSLYFQNRGSQ